MHDFENGFMFGYNYRPDNYSSINGSLCTNIQNYNGISFGKFKCPLEGYDLDETECCDLPDRQFCCTPSVLFSSSMDYEIIFIS